MPLVTDDFASLTTRPQTPPSEILGSGGALAWVLVHLGVYKDVKRAKSQLNWHADVLASDDRDEAWHRDAMMSALGAAGFCASEVDIASGQCDLGAELRAGGRFFIDGTLNPSYMNADGDLIQQDPMEELPGPEVDESKWRHMVAIKDGHILEQLARSIPVECLWLRPDRTIPMPDVRKGYMRSIDRVFRLRELTREEQAAKFAAELAARKQVALGETTVEE